MKTINSLKEEIRKLGANRPQHGTPEYQAWFSQFCDLQKQLGKLEIEKLESEHARRRLEIHPL